MLSAAEGSGMVPLPIMVLEQPSRFGLTLSSSLRQ